MPNLNLEIAKIMKGDTEIVKIMQGNVQKWPYVPPEVDLSSFITHKNVGYNILSGTGKLSGGSAANDSTDYIDIEGYSSIRYSMVRRTSTTNIGIAFYSDKSESSYISGVAATRVSSTPTDYVDAVADVPPNAKYVRMTIRKNNQGWSAPYLYGIW